MSIPDISGPLGLADGSVRAILAIAFTGVTIFLWGTQAPVPPELLATTSLVVGNYFGSRGAASTDSARADEPLNAPYIPDDREDNA